MSFTQKTISGWKWGDLISFNVDKVACDLALLPIPRGETISSMQPNESDDGFGGVDFYYVGWHPEIETVLGPPTNFDINIFNED